MASSHRPRFPLLLGDIFIPVRAVSRLGLVLAACLIGTSSAHGQLERGTTPSTRYFGTIQGAFQEGEYRDALDLFTMEGRSAIRTAESRWIDSICYETMAGECYYEMGQPGKALEHFTAAVKLYVAFSDWMLRVNFPPQIRPAAAGTLRPTPWGQSAQRFRLGHYPETMLISQGRIDNNPQYRHGGVVQPATLFSIQVQEIVRATTLAIRRRTELLGPTAPHDPLTAELLTALSRRPAPPNHWSEAWIDVQLGLALLAAGRDAQGKDALMRSLLAAGEYYHPMTSIALVELGKLALRAGEFPVAAKYFEEATYPAVYYPDASVLEEALRLGALTHLMANRPGIYPPLATAAEWARVKGLRQLQASVLILAAENCLALGQTAQATRFLDDARTAVGRRTMGSGRIGTRLSFLAAAALFQQRRVAEGEAALAAALGPMRQGSLWLFHIALTDNLLAGGTLSPRVAMDLYTELLRDPQAFDWNYSPMEALAVLTTPHPGPFERWFEVALLRKEHERAMEIADLARRHRYFSAIPFGGRLQALRWVLEGPEEMRDNQARLHRQDLLARYPAYAQRAQQAQAIRTELKALPLQSDDREVARKQTEALGRLAAVAAEQEAILREMAVRREPAGMIFPPVCATKDIQDSMPEGHALLVFFATSRHLYAFLLNRERYAYWQVGSPATLGREIVALLRAMGQFQSNSELALADLGDTNWKKPAGQVLDLILRGSQADFAQAFDELVIVPDGVLWYVPFEALQVTVEGRQRPLISRFRIRYAPTASLAVAASDRGRKPTGNTAVVVGKLFPRDDAAVALAEFERLAAVLPGAVEVKPPPPGPSSVFGTLFDRLVVLDDLGDTGQNAFGWAPAPLDRGKPGSLLSDWLSLPWGGPDEIVLPGYHTAAEDSLKAVNQAAPGHEVFLSVCGLMSTGARTLLISRWRAGGKTAFDLVREFTQELPHTMPADAWQRAVFLAAASRLDLDAEPRVKRAVTEETPAAAHPFFWAGYMLVDPGVVPVKPGPKAEPPVVRVQPDEPAPADKAEP